MKLRWSVVARGSLRLILCVLLAIVAAGAAFMLLIQLLLAVHLHALE